VVGVLVGQRQGPDLAALQAQSVEALADLAQGYARVDEQRPPALGQGVAVPLGTGGECRIVHGPA